MSDFSRSFAVTEGGGPLRPNALAIIAACALVALGGVAVPGASYASEQTMEVTVTAYNSVPEQTNEQPNIAALGDRIEPGMKVVAVSRDLLDIGLRRGSKVRIEGLPGEYEVLDKMHWRWQRSIDLYMGDAGVLHVLADVILQPQVFLQQHRILFFLREPAAVPGLGDAQPHSDRIDFLSHSGS